MDCSDAICAPARVVEAGSSTKVAQALHMSKTTMTQLIQQLKACLHVKLLHRTTHKLGMTSSGATCYERIVRLSTDTEDAEDSPFSAVTTPRGRLRADVPSPLTCLILALTLPASHVRYSDTQFGMGVGNRVVDLTGDNVDCVPCGGEIADQSLVARHVGDLQISVYVAPHYVERLGTPAHPRELQNTDYRTVGFAPLRSRKIGPLVLRSESEQIGIMGNYVLAVDDGNACLEVRLAGLSVTTLPVYMMTAHQAVGALIPLFAQ